MTAKRPAAGSGKTAKLHGVSWRRHEAICENIRDEVYHLLDGRLPKGARREVLAHLKSCPSCFSKYELERIVRTVVKGKVLAEECPKTLFAKIRAAIACECAKPGAGRVSPRRAH